MLKKKKRYKCEVCGCNLLEGNEKKDGKHTYCRACFYAHKRAGSYRSENLPTIKPRKRR